MTSYADTAVLAGATYSYSIKSFDAAGNHSVASNTAQVTTRGAQIGVAPTSVNPNTGSGSSQTFDFIFTDSLGYQSISFAELDLAQSLTATRACLIYFAPAWNQLWLANDAGTAWTGPITLGSSSILQNSQCQIAGLSSF